MKYNSQTIFDYICGNEIEDIDKLESNVEFMTDIINHTNDKKIC